MKRSRWIRARWTKKKPDKPGWYWAMDVIPYQVYVKYSPKHKRLMAHIYNNAYDLSEFTEWLPATIVAGDAVQQ